MLELSGRLAVVTGASRGIGAAVAEALHGAGASVARLARSLVERDVGGDRWLDLRCDLTQDEDLARAVTRIMRRGVPDLVVNGAGAFAYGPFETTGVDTLDTLYRANLRVPYTVARAFLPGMRRAGRGPHTLPGRIAHHHPPAHNAPHPAPQPGLPGFYK